MKSFKEYLAAGVPVKLAVGGKLLYVQRSQAGAVLSITFHSGAATQGVAGVGKGFKAGPVGGFDQITFLAAESGTVEFIVTDGDVNAQFDDASTIIGNDDGQAVPIRLKAGERLPVDMQGGTVNVNAENVGINNGNASPVPIQYQALATLSNKAAVVVNTGVAQAVLADATLKRAVFRNGSANGAKIGLGGVGVTMATAAIVLQPGETWVETDAAGAAWYAASDINGADLRMLGVKP